MPDAPDTPPKHQFFDGVEMKPGVRVFCRDRESAAYDCEGTLITVHEQARHWSYTVTYDGPGGREGGPTITHDADAIWPTMEETRSEAAIAWRAARQLRVFLCHGSEDKPAVRDLHARLLKAGMRPWLDEKDIPPGAEWDSAIREAVRGCHIVLVVLSKKSVSKTGYVQKEIRFALDRALEKPEGTAYIIPAKLDDCKVPDSLGKWQWVDLSTADGAERLLNALAVQARAMNLG